MVANPGQQLWGGGASIILSEYKRRIEQDERILVWLLEDLHHSESA